ncbi:hypothetical protein DIE14_01470 [Burkholderia sp. Bp9017]|uniref:OmpH family outer membrane protein n=1 Tax=unclassified Burkholderia TaxID=2613784 RepID=UPI000F5FFCB2|nr:MULTISPECIES: OmpH family outer membrane protein [unclassified Burkholderia]RQZ31613.1 hypothetical protein DIE14_01470 [Burkholderia sp. Bp9017]RQZ37744.1 hypothetical protein DIE13_01460 [Burkholderia sp. Bp9016]
MSNEQSQDVDFKAVLPEEGPAAGSTAPAGNMTPAWVIVALLFAIALGAFGVYRTYSGAGAAPAFYTLDVDTLIEAKRIQQERTTDVAQYGAAMTKFMTETRDIIRSLAQRGIVIVRADAVLTPASGVDITARVAEKLGLQAEVAQVPGRLSRRASTYQQEIAGASGAAATGPDAAPAPATTGTEIAPPANAASGVAQPASGAANVSPLSKLD